MPRPTEPSAGDAEQRYERLVTAFLGQPGVSDRGSGWGASSLKVDGRMFAMLPHQRTLVVKLPRARVDTLVESGDGVRYDPRRGRPLKEWLELSPASPKRWSKLAAEALEFVRGA